MECTGVCKLGGQDTWVAMSSPDLGPTRLTDPNRSPRRDTIYTIYILCCTGTLIDLFFIRVVPVPVVYKQFL